jgi:hypothetical protein
MFLEICYVFKYPEYIPDEGVWTIRQTAVYAKMPLDDAQPATWILLNPQYNSTVESSLRSALRDKSPLTQFLANSAAQHLAIITSVFHNWRDYLSHLDMALQEQVSAPCFHSIRSLQKS